MNCICEVTAPSNRPRRQPKPTLAGPAEVRSIAVPEPFGDGFDRHVGLPQIPNRELLTHVVEQHLIRSPLRLELSDERAVRHVEVLRHLIQVRVVALSVEQAVEDPLRRVAIALAARLGPLAQVHCLPKRGRVCSDARGRCERLGHVDHARGCLEAERDAPKTRRVFARPRRRRVGEGDPSVGQRHSAHRLEQQAEGSDDVQ